MIRIYKPIWQMEGCSFGSYGRALRYLALSTALIYNRGRGISASSRIVISPDPIALPFVNLEDFKQTTHIRIQLDTKDH